MRPSSCAKVLCDSKSDIKHVVYLTFNHIKELFHNAAIDYLGHVSAICIIAHTKMDARAKQHKIIRDVFTPAGFIDLSHAREDSEIHKEKHMWW